MSFQVQGTASKVFAGLSKKLVKKEEARLKAVADKVHTQLKTRMTNFSDRYKSGDGMSVYDAYRGNSSSQEGRIITGWKMSRRTSGISSDSVSYQFRNEVPHAVYLYGKKSSNGEQLRSSKNRNYRSAKNHTDVHRRGYDVQTRENQLTAQKWKRFVEDFRSQMKKRK